MLKQFIAWIQEMIRKMMHINDAQRALHTEIAMSSAMRDAIDLWSAMYQDQAPWLDDNTQSLGLSAAIAGEVARLVCVELESGIDGSPRAEWLQEQYAAVLSRLRQDVETACAGGGLVFKPYVDSGRIAVDCVPAWRFLPTSFAHGEITGAVFVEQITRGKVHYTRLELHELTDEEYRIRNLAYRSETDGTLGTPCSLDAVDEWSELEPETHIRYKDGSVPEGMLFAWFRLPLANNIDPGSPLGVSAYARATGLIQEADKQYSRILWEYEGSELAIDASYGALQVPASGETAKLPQRKRRLFRQLSLDKGQNGDLYEIFSPAIRDSSLFHGLDQLLKRIEFSCSLAYGTLSDPQSVEKTAEEIRASKQRSYSAVCEIQTALQHALEHLVWVMDFYGTAYQLAPKGEYEVTFTWGDGVLQDTDKEFAARKALVDAGYLKPEKLIAWYFGVSDEAALELMPGAEPGLGFEV